MLRKYIEEHIFPIYSRNDKAHGMEHIQYVIRRSLSFAESIPEANPDMVYVIAAFHDIAHHIDPSHHDILSAKVLRADMCIGKFFSEEQMEIMAQAVEDHRSSSDHEPRSIYGKIVATADRDTDLNTALLRTYQYRKKHYPEMSLDEIIKDSMPVIKDHFGKGGSSRRTSYIKDPEFIEMCEEVDRITADINLYRDAYLAMLRMYPNG